MSLDLSVFWVILFVLLIIAVINTLLFKPLLNVIQQREHAVQSARSLAEKAAADASAATLEYEQRTRAARAEVHREMDEVRKSAEARRAELLAATRADAEAQLAEARARLKADTDAARDRLAADADALGDVIVERVLGRSAR